MNYTSLERGLKCCVLNYKMLELMAARQGYTQNEKALAELIVNSLEEPTEADKVVLALYVEDTVSPFSSPT